MLWAPKNLQNRVESLKQPSVNLLLRGVELWSQHSRTEVPLFYKDLTCQRLFSRARNPACTADPTSQPHNAGLIHTLARTNMTAPSNITFGYLLHNSKRIGYMYISSLIVYLQLHHRHNDTFSQRHTCPGMFAFLSQHNKIPHHCSNHPHHPKEAQAQTEVFKYQLDLIRSIFCSRSCSWVGDRLKNNECPHEHRTITSYVQKPIREANSR